MITYDCMVTRLHNCMVASSLGNNNCIGISSKKNYAMHVGPRIAPELRQSPYPYVSFLVWMPLSYACAMSLFCLDTIFPCLPSHFDIVKSDLTSPPDVRYA